METGEKKEHNDSITPAYKYFQKFIYIKKPYIQAICLDDSPIDQKSQNLQGQHSHRSQQIQKTNVSQDNQIKQTQHTLKSQQKANIVNKKIDNVNYNNRNIDYKDYFNRRKQRPIIDLGVSTLNELVYYAHSHNLISNEIYFEFITDESFQKIMEFIKVIIDPQFLTMPYIDYKITLADHRRISQLLVKIDPNKFILNAPEFLNQEMHEFVNLIYEIPMKQYEQMMEILDKKTQNIWWQQLKIKFYNLFDNNIPSKRQVHHHQQLKANKDLLDGQNNTYQPLVQQIIYVQPSTTTLRTIKTKESTKPNVTKQVAQRQQIINTSLNDSSTQFKEQNKSILQNKKDKESSIKLRSQSKSIDRQKLKIKKPSKSNIIQQEIRKKLSIIKSQQDWNQATKDKDKKKKKKLLKELKDINENKLRKQYTKKQKQQSIEDQNNTYKLKRLKKFTQYKNEKSKEKISKQQQQCDIYEGQSSDSEDIYVFKGKREQFIRQTRLGNKRKKLW